KNEKQTAYKIVVDLIEPNRGKNSTCWDSGWVASDRMAQITYSGKPLESDRFYRWSVQVRDAAGLETSSQLAFWTTGLFDQKQWSAKWIGSDQLYDPELGIKGLDNNIDDPWLRKTVSLKEKPTQAVMFVASIGYHELFVNGKKIADHVLAPNVSNHTRRARYIAYDIADSLKPGDNVIAIWLGTGWSIYQGYISPGLARTPQVIAQSDLYFASGKKQRIVTDESWKVFPSPNRLLGSWNFSNYGGERWDDSRNEPNWNMVGFDDSSWKQVTVYNPRPLVAPRISSKNDPNRVVPQEELLDKSTPLPLTAQMSEPNRLQHEIRPVGIESKGDGIWRIDMGVNFAGWTRIKLVGKPGDVVKIEFSEAEKLQMTFRNRNEFVIGPSGKGEFRNRFNYSSGRWITLIGLREKPSLDSIRGWSVRTDFESAGSFECSDELLNWIYRTVRWTYENLSVGGYVVDCPQRERLGYGGD
ncbi:MAG: family 78 glycoside hydrolase catalytic domain, partial [Planctomycetia bacterium]|nr:family 78 glycoside hydrolase catalytic domain [Planctomycetia bacterium]